MKKPLIGILGGSGSEAGLYVIKCLHRYVQKEYGAIQDKDYPDYILYNKPLDGFDETGIVDYNKVLTSFKEACNNMFNMGVTIIGIACNTLHTLIKYIDFPKDIQFCHLINLCGSHFIGFKKSVLVLGSATTRKEGLYSKVLIDKGVSIIQVNDIEQELIDCAIEKVMGNNYTDYDFNVLYKIIQNYNTQYNLGSVILGCTELPLIFENKNSSVPIVSSSEVLAKSLVEIYLKQKK